MPSFLKCKIYINSKGSVSFAGIFVYNEKSPRLKLTFQPGALFGAADEARTRYLHLGKVALYQMSYGRIKKSPKIIRRFFVGCPSPT